MKSGILVSVRHGGVAHRLEQAAHNRLVVGSIPTAPTIAFYFRSLAAEFVKCFSGNTQYLYQ